MFRILRRWETRIAVNYSMLSLAGSGITVIFAAHWIGCAWCLQAHLQDDLDATWLGAGGYCEETLVQVDGQMVPAEPKKFDCLSEGSQYMASVYWAVMTITSIGYGDIAAT